MPVVIIAIIIAIVEGYCPGDPADHPIEPARAKRRHMHTFVHGSKQAHQGEAMEDHGWYEQHHCPTQRIHQPTGHKDGQTMAQEAAYSMPIRTDIEDPQRCPAEHVAPWQLRGTHTEICHQVLQSAWAIGHTVIPPQKCVIRL